MKIPIYRDILFEIPQRIGLDFNPENAQDTKNHQAAEYRQNNHLSIQIDVDDPVNYPVHPVEVSGFVGMFFAGQRNNTHHGRQQRQNDDQQAEHTEAGKNGKFTNRGNPIDK